MVCRKLSPLHPQPLPPPTQTLHLQEGTEEKEVQARASDINIIGEMFATDKT